MKFIALLVISAFVSSCASTYDPGYLEAEAKADSSAKRGAIVGMWHRKAWDGFTGSTSYALLFKSDGSGYYDGYGEDLLTLGPSETAAPFTWQYVGNGIWKTSEAWIGTLKVSGNKLLSSSGYLLYDRVN